MIVKSGIYIYICLELYIFLFGRMCSLSVKFQNKKINIFKSVYDLMLDHIHSHLGLQVGHPWCKGSHLGRGVKLCFLMSELSSWWLMIRKQHKGWRKYRVNRIRRKVILALQVLKYSFPSSKETSKQHTKSHSKSFETSGLRHQSLRYHTIQLLAVKECGATHYESAWYWNVLDQVQIISSMWA